MSKSFVEKEVERLKSVTVGARYSMHEPDEQGIEAKVVGNHLDNAMGPDPEGRYGEFNVIITQETDEGTKTETFNLADLIAMAKLAKDQAYRLNR